MPPTSWADLIGRRIGLYGVGAEGRAALRACRARGFEPVMVDDDPHAGSRLDLPVLPWVSGGREALRACDVVIKTPGISRYGSTVRELTEAGVQVVGALGLWLAGHPDRTKVLCITGTKGKSTTTAIAGHLLTRWGYRCFTGGNLGPAPFDPDCHADDVDYWVVEVSSYQATDVFVAPPVTVLTSLHPDHLPWHQGDVEVYYRDKLTLCSRPGAAVTVANGDSPLLRAHRDLLARQVDWVHAPVPGDLDWTWVSELGLPGEHNRRNAVLAAHALQRMGIPEANDRHRLLSAAAGFDALPNRLQTVATLDGVTFVDDSLSTNVLPTLAAVEAFPDQPLALIVGGQERDIDYRPLAVGLRPRARPTLLLTIPDNGPRIAAEVTGTDPGPNVRVHAVEDLAAAVRYGYRWARPTGGVVLLSPAAASFGRFVDYKDRARAFGDTITTLARAEHAG